MATGHYDYSLASNFGDEIHLRQFHDEVDAATGIPATFQGVSFSEDDVTVIFSTTITNAEKTTLDGLVSSHVGATGPARNRFFPVYPENISTKNTTYTCMSSFKYDGSSQIGNIDYIDVVAKKDSAVTSYGIKIIDRMNNDITIAEKTGMTNTDYDVVSLGPISNLPTSYSIFEVHAKRTGGSGNEKNVFINQLIIYYGN